MMKKIKKIVILMTVMLFLVINIVTFTSAEINLKKQGNIKRSIYLNSPPYPPEIPDGPDGSLFHRVYIGNSYTYTTSTIDPECDDISYQWDWGDGNISQWSVFLPSGAYATGSWTWEESGTYQVRARAKDTGDHESDWSLPLEVTVRKPFGASVIQYQVTNLISQEQTNIFLKLLQFNFIKNINI